MRKSLSIFLLLTWLAMGTGLLAYLHELQHCADDQHAGVPAQQDRQHCQIHAQLHTPALPELAQGCAPGVERHVETITLQPQRLESALDHAPDACRGPPTV